jgi:hypothetical protein
MTTRPTLPITLVRREVVQLRLTTNELHEFNAQALRDGVTLSDLLRTAAWDRVFDYGAMRADESVQRELRNEEERQKRDDADQAAWEGPPESLF